MPANGSDPLIEAATARYAKRREAELASLRNLGFSEAEVREMVRDIVLKAMAAHAPTPKPTEVPAPVSSKEGSGPAPPATTRKPTHLQYEVLQIVAEGGGKAKPRSIYDHLVARKVIAPVEKSHVARVMGIVSKMADYGWFMKAGPRGDMTVLLTEDGWQVYENTEPEGVEKTAASG